MYPHEIKNIYSSVTLIVLSTLFARGDFLDIVQDNTVRWKPLRESGEGPSAGLFYLLPIMPY